MVFCSSYQPPRLNLIGQWRKGYGRGHLITPIGQPKSVTFKWLDHFDFNNNSDDVDDDGEEENNRFDLRQHWIRDGKRIHLERVSPQSFTGTEFNCPRAFFSIVQQFGRLYNNHLTDDDDGGQPEEHFFNPHKSQLLFFFHYWILLPNTPPPPPHILIYMYFKFYS